MQQRTRLLKAALIAGVAAMLAACGSSGKPSVSPLKKVVGTELAGAQGKTEHDQDKIDSAMAGLCGARVYDKALCDVHTKASAARIGELRK